MHNVHLVADFNGIYDADDGGIDRAILALERHARRTTLHDEHHLIHAGSHCIDGDQVTLLILALDVDHPCDEQLAAMKTIIFSRGYDSSDYSSKKHGSFQFSVFSFQWSVVNDLVLLTTSPLKTEN